MPKTRPPGGTKPRGRRSGVGKRASAAVIKLPAKRSRPGPRTPQETTDSIVDLSVGIEYLLPKSDDE